MPKQIINYSKTIIYKIVCNDLNVKECYVGHTTDFPNRKRSHKNRCNNTNSKKYHYKIYKIIRDHEGWDNWSMIEIEKFPCKDFNEASKRERYWYEILNAKLNSRNPFMSKEEYRETHVHDKKEYDKLYRNKNKEKRLEQFDCKCGGKYQYKSKSTHYQTKLHQTYIYNEKLKNGITQCLTFKEFCKFMDN